MSDMRETTITLLEQAAKTHQYEIEGKVRGRLNDREGHLLEWLLEQYRDEQKRRWYDPYHILFSTNFALDLVKVETLDRLIVSGIILHDVGYLAIQDSMQWSNPDIRITHMQEGVALAARVLFEHGFTAPELEKILGMIAVHDNPYLGIEIEGRDRLGLRDCDRAWVMHILSFYKDVTSKPGRYDQPREYLHDRMVQFYGWEQPFGDEWTVTLAKIRKNIQRIEIPTYDFTRKYVKRQFERRIQELQDGDLLYNAERFRAYLHDQIAGE
jgi:hypothetical protein